MLIVLVFVIRIYSYLLLCLECLLRIVCVCGFFGRGGVCLFAFAHRLLYCLRFVWFVVWLFVVGNCGHDCFL